MIDFYFLPCQVIQLLSQWKQTTNMQMSTYYTINRKIGVLSAILLEVSLGSLDLNISFDPWF